MKRTWLAENVYQIQLQEDYIFTAKSLIYAQTGLCRYSGLGNTNLNDGRIQLKPSNKIEKFPIEEYSPAILQDWYCVKFISEQPFVGVTTNRCTMNIAIMNSAAYTGFVAAYKAKSEAARVKIAACIVSVNRTRYMDPENSPYLGSSVYQIRFKSPYGEGSDTDETLTWTTLNDEKCYIIVGPSEVRNINPVIMQVSAIGGGSAKSFNTNSHFWELEAQYYLRLYEMQPVPFSPSTFGLTSSFNIYLSIGYEPYGENYVIIFGKMTSGTFDPYGQAPIAQRCQTTITFITDNILNLHEEATHANTLALIGGLAGGSVSILAGAASGNALGMIQGVLGMEQSYNSFVMKQKQQAVAEYCGMGMTGTIGGSIDWSQSAFNTASWCYIISQEPVTDYSGWWTYKGKPDGNWRLLSTLTATGYAEIELQDITGQGAMFTTNELNQIMASLNAGVIFNGNT